MFTCVYKHAAVRWIRAVRDALKKFELVQNSLKQKSSLCKREAGPVSARRQETKTETKTLNQSCSYSAFIIDLLQ